MASYKDLKKKAKELSAKVRSDVAKNDKDGGLAVQIAVFVAKIKELEVKKDKTSANRLQAMKKTLKTLLSNFKRLNKEEALALEKKLGLKQ